MSVEHRNIPAHGVHIPHAFKTADLSTLVVTTLDIDKLALLTTDNTYHKLTSIEPSVWTKMTVSSADIKAVTHSIDEVIGLQTALDGKVDKVVDKGLSTNDLTNDLLTLLTTNKVKSITTDALNDKLVVTYTDGTVANLNINDIVTDVYVSGATLNATTNVLTLTSASGGADVTVDLSTFVNSDEITNYYTKDSIYIKEEVDTKIEQAITAGQIDDTIEATTKSWSSEKTSNEIAKAMLLHEILYHE